jgi:hypothetical protein
MPKTILICKACGKEFLDYASSKHKSCSRLCRNKLISMGLKGKPNHRLGVKLSLETRLEMSKAQSGEKNYNWKGGITKIQDRIRKGLAYREWRNQVFKRDNYTCQECGVTKCYVQADHIKSFALHPEFRYQVENGRTLCLKCHRNTPSYGARVHKYESASL